MSADTFSPEAERAFRESFRAAVLEGRQALQDENAEIDELVEAAYQAREGEVSRTETNPVVTARLRGRHHGLAFLRNLSVAHEQSEHAVAEWYSKIVTWAESPCDKLVAPPFHPGMLARVDGIEPLPIGRPVVMPLKGGSDRDVFIRLQLENYHVVTIAMLDRDGRSERRTAIASLNGWEFARDIITPDSARERDSFVGVVQKALGAIGAREGFEPVNREVIANSIIEAADTSRDAGQRGNRVFTLHDCASLAEGEFQLDYIIPDILVAGQPCLMGGQSKTMKTSIGLDLALSVATGTPFLGEFKVAMPQRVGMFSAESGMATIAETLRRIASHKRLDLNAVGAQLLVSPDVPRFGDRKSLDRWRQSLIDNQIQLAFIDPLYLCISGENQGNVSMTGVELRSVGAIAEELGITLVILAHLRKNMTGTSPHRVPELSDLSGAGLTEWARQWLLLGRRSPYVAGAGFHDLHFVVGGSAGHQNQWSLDIWETDGLGERVWRPTVNRPATQAEIEERKAEAKAAQFMSKLEADKATILREIAKLTGCVGTKTTIRDRCGLGTTKFNAAIGALLRDNLIEQTTVTKGSNREYEAFRLVDHGQTVPPFTTFTDCIGTHQDASG